MRRLCGLALLGACGGQPVDDRTLELHGPLRVAVDSYGPVQGPQIQLSDGSTPTSVAWSSANPEVAEVDAGGAVSAVGAGTAVISGRWNDDDVSWTVVVEPLINLRFERPPDTVVSGETIDLVVRGYYQEAPVEVDLRWATSDDRIASVSASGEVTGLEAGTVYITAEGRGAEAMIELEVTAPD